MSKTFKNNYSDITIDDVAKLSEEWDTAIGIEREDSVTLLLGYSDTDEHVFTYNPQTRQLFTDKETSNG